MKRARVASALVSYESSDEDATGKEESEMPPKRKKLPSLSDTLEPNAHRDDPALHQGRIRTVPHVEGQYAAHVYASVTLDSQPLRGILEEVLCTSMKEVPSLHEIGRQPPADDAHGKGGPLELHISMSQPIYLRAHQRDDLKRAVKFVAQVHSAFRASFADFRELTNDEKTRAFLTMQVGAGHEHFERIARALAPTLRSLRQKEYYVDPHFHTSIAWALLVPQTPARSALIIRAVTTGIDMDGTENDPGGARHDATTGLPRSFISMLNENFAERLSSRKVGAFLVDTIYLKIGKDVSSWRLSGFAST